ncbi:MAG: LamG domain-containing protein, partial [Actinomycetota bacterium]|nr:LamG domain-containing protein [Actinomycetota bacterium]
YAFVTGGTAIPAGSWHQVAVVFDGANLTVYVDGLADGSTATTVTSGAGSGDLRIGARGDDANQRFSGGMDEVAVYDHPLSGGEIATHYLTGAER